MKKIMIFWAVRMKKHAMFLFSIVSAFFAVSSYAAEFKEPVLLWEREFDPPVREISDQNSNGDFLAIQEEKEKGSGRILKQKLLVIDSKGNIKREELLPARRKRTIPADQLWLTALSEKELGQLKKAAKPKQVDTWGENMYVSGNGEYYAIITRGVGSWYELEYKDKGGKTLWKAYPKDNYGFWKVYISHDGSRIVVINMGGLGGGDEWEVLGQRVYFYDISGKLLKDYDYGEKTDDWLNPERILFSKNSQYVGGLRGYATSAPFSNEHSVVLFSSTGGRILYSKKLLARHLIYQPTDRGEVLVFRDYLNTKYILNRDGNIIWKEDPPHKASHSQISSDKSILNMVKTYDDKKKLREISIHRLPDNKLIFTVNISEILGEFYVDYTSIDGVLEKNGILFSFCGHQENGYKLKCILLDVGKKKVLYRGERGIGRFADEGKLTISAGSKVTVYSLTDGK